MASTEKVSLSLESGALLLARRAAAIEGPVGLGVRLGLVKQHAWSSQRPRLSPDEQARADERLVEIDERELWHDGGGRRAAG